MAGGKLTKRLSLALGAILVFLCAPTAWHVGAAEILKSDFEIVVDCQSDSPKLCAVGKLKAGTQMTLLQSQPTKTCPVAATALTDELESAGAFLTELQGSCEIPKEFGVAVVKKSIKDYEALPAKPTSDTNVVLIIKGVAWNSDALSQLLQKARGAFPATSRNSKALKDLSVFPSKHRNVYCLLR